VVGAITIHYSLYQAAELLTRYPLAKYHGIKYLLEAIMAKKRATALSNSPTLLQLWDALGSKLIEATQGQLPSKQRVVGSNPARDALASIFALFRVAII